MDFHPNIITKPMFMGDNKKLQKRINTYSINIKKQIL